MKYTSEYIVDGYFLSIFWGWMWKRLSATCIGYITIMSAFQINQCYMAFSNLSSGRSTMRLILTDKVVEAKVSFQISSLALFVFDLWWIWGLKYSQFSALCCFTQTFYNLPINFLKWGQSDVDSQEFKRIIRSSFKISKFQPYHKHQVLIFRPFTQPFRTRNLKAD